MADARKNFAYSTVATAPSPATSGTSLVVAAGTGTRFPTPPFNAVVWATNAQALSSNAEIVRVTDIATDTLTITRAQESSTARSIVVGDQISAGITDKTLTDAEEIVRISGNSGAAGNDITFQALTANATDNTTVTLATVMTTTGVGVGTWTFKYSILFQTAATATGVKIANNHTGTVTTYQMTSHYVTTGATAATGVHDDISAVGAAGINEGFAERVLNTSSKATVGVGTINANQIMIVEGILVVTASGSLEFKFASEIAGSAARVMAGSVLELKRII